MNHFVLALLTTSSRHSNLWDIANEVSMAITSQFINILHKYGIVKFNMEERLKVIQVIIRCLLPTSNQEQTIFQEHIRTPQVPNNLSLGSSFLQDEEEEATFSQQLGSFQTSSSPRPFDPVAFSLSQRNVELASKLSRHLQKSQDEVVAKALDMYWDSINKKNSIKNKVAEERSEMEEVR